jgi:hypothetical protein
MNGYYPYAQIVINKINTQVLQILARKDKNLALEWDLWLRRVLSECPDLKDSPVRFTQLTALREAAAQLPIVEILPQ